MVKQIPNYIANQILRAADLIQQWKSQSQDSLLGYSGTTRDPKDFDIGDLLAITNGALLKDILMRTGGKFKNYSGAGALLGEITIDDLLLASSIIDSNHIQGLSCSSNITTPNSKIDVNTGECLAKDRITLLETSGIVANLLNHITPVLNTTYHMFIYKHSGTGVILIDFSTSVNPTAGTAANQLPNLDGTKYRRIGSFTVDSSANFYPFKSEFENGSIRVILDTPLSIYSGVGTGYTGSRAVIDTRVCPTIPDVLGTFSLSYYNSSTTQINEGILTDLNTNDVAPTQSLNTNGGGVNGAVSDHGSAKTIIYTRVRLIGFRVANNVSGTFGIHIHDWVDFRINN